MARLRGSLSNDTLAGTAGNDRLFGNYGNDTLNGGAGKDRLDGGRGNDVLNGGDGNDIIKSRSDGGETPIAQDINAANDPNTEVNAATRMIYAGQAGLPANDTLRGGAGADQFRIEALLNAKLDIIQKHTNANGVIDWAGVTGENNLVHDHWLDSIGNDVITDFNKAQGDTLKISGHTVEVNQIEIKDADGDGAVDDTVLHLRSNQGAGGGAHNLDLLGTVTVLNNQLTANDFTVDAMATDGIVKNIKQVNEAINPYNPVVAAPAPVVAPAPATPPGLDHDLLAERLTAPAGAAAGQAPTAGDDVIIYGDGNDNGAGGKGNDLMIGAAGNDKLSGGMGDDRMDGGVGNDTMHGGQGNDLVSGGAGNDSMTGDLGDDILVGGDGMDQLMGNRGQDALFGDAGADVLRGGAGNDILMGGVGADSIDGGGGTDAALFNGALADYTVNFAGDAIEFTNANGETDVVNHVEQFRFLGNSATYTVQNGALALTTDTGDLNTHLADHLIEHLIADGSGGGDADVVALAHAAPAAVAAVPVAPVAPMDMHMPMTDVMDAGVQHHDLMAA